MNYFNLSYQYGSNFINNKGGYPGNTINFSQYNSSIQYSSIICFIISTLIVFIISLTFALTLLRCYDYFKSRNTQVGPTLRFTNQFKAILLNSATLCLYLAFEFKFLFYAFLQQAVETNIHSCILIQVSRFLYSSPPSYDTVTKIDRTELPTYHQACTCSSSQSSQPDKLQHPIYPRK